MVLHGFAPALGAAQSSRFVLGEMFDMLEDLAALLATVLVGGHGAPSARSRKRLSVTPAAEQEF
jgi:hypothetical protein